MSTPIIYTDPAEAEQAMANDAVCRKIGGHIVKKYPHRQWMVEVIDMGRVCRIRCPQISMDYGMQFKIMDLMEFNFRKAEMFAGEILERFNLTRGVSDGADVKSLHRGIKGVIGEAEGEISANKPELEDVSFVDANGNAMTGVKVNA